MPENRNIFIRLTSILAGIFLLATLIVTFQLIYISIDPGTVEPFKTHYNNYTIFRNAFNHLIENKDLYQPYPTEYWDLYKYSPTFALFMAPIAILPNAAGLLFWNLINVFVLFFAIRKLPCMEEKQKVFLYAIIFIELITSLQNSQSNALITGLILFAFYFLDKRKITIAALFIISAAFIKPFALAALPLFLLYPGKVKAVATTVIWTLIFAILPLIAVSWSQLSFLYESWFNMLRQDEEVSYGLSLLGIIHRWFGAELKLPALLTGTLLLFLPLSRLKSFSDQRFRMMYLAFILIWMIIFNYKSESPTYIIAMTGVAIWFMISQRKEVDYFLLFLALIFTVLSPTDLFPQKIRNEYFVPYFLKAIPCIIIWIRMLFQFWLWKTKEEELI